MSQSLCQKLSELDHSITYFYWIQEEGLGRQEIFRPQGLWPLLFVEILITLLLVSCHLRRRFTISVSLYKVLPEKTLIEFCSLRSPNHFVIHMSDQWNFGLYNRSNDSRMQIHLENFPFLKRKSVLISTLSKRDRSRVKFIIVVDNVSDEPHPDKNTSNVLRVT